MPSQHGFDVRAGAGPLHLHLPPSLCVVAERNLARLWVDVLPGDDRRRNLVEPPLSVDLAGEASGVFAKRAVDSNESLVGAGTVAATRALLGLPVLVSSAMPAGGILIVDRAAVIGAQSPVRLARSDDAYFSSDSVGVRLTWRSGWSVMHPARVVKLTTIPPAP
ncbi:MAG: phage major capsid protein [Mycobacterium sp.]